MSAPAAVVKLLAGLVEERAGMHYGPEQQPLLADKLQWFATDTGFESLLDYYYFLRYDPSGGAALDALVDALLVNETYFFRENGALRVVVDDVLAPRVRQGVRPRLWCAASSTGEEPLTVAMMLDERDLLGRVDLVATDLATRVLDRARAGRYGSRSLRALPDGVMGRWLAPVDDGAQVEPRLCQSVAWQQLNLTDTSAIRALGTFDAILLRNVLLYFSDATIARILPAFIDALVPGGVLLVGASESLLRFGTALRCEERGGAFLYVKPGTAP